MESQWRSLITFGWIKLMSLFVQFLKTYGPVSARGSAFCFHLELRADGRRVGSHQTSLTNSPSCLMLIFCWCRKGGIMKYFMANFHAKLSKPTRLFSFESLVWLLFTDRYNWIKLDLTYIECCLFRLFLHRQKALVWWGRKVFLLCAGTLFIGFYLIF